MRKDKTYIRPYVYQRPSITSICIRMFILLALQIAALLMTGSYKAIGVIFASFAGSLCVYLVDLILYRTPFHHSLYIMVQGLLTGFLLPETFPPAAVFFISFLVLLVTKNIFMELSNMWANMTAITVMIAWFIGQRFFPGFQINGDLLSVKNPSLFLISDGYFPANKFDSTITTFLNNNIFRFLKVSVPEGYVSMFWDTHSIIPAFRFNLLTIFSSIILYADDALDYFIPAIFLSVYLILVRVFAPVLYSGAINNGDILLAVLSSGTLFISTFLIQWFGTVPVTTIGKIVYASLAGVLAFLITGSGTSPVGMVFTIVICNVLNLIIRVLEENQNTRKLNRILAVETAKGE